MIKHITDTIPAKRFEILIVDDIPDNIQLLSHILNEQNFDISFSTSGKQALATIIFNPPNLILLDIAMPEMDGFQVCTELKKNPITAGIPIIFLTAKTQPEDIVKGFELGAVDYITKPFNTAELISRVNTHLNLKKAQDIIKQQNKELEELNATKDKFFSIIAHDLKNPFHTLIGFSELILDNYANYDSEKIKKFVAMMHDTSKQGHNLLENLLQWSRNQTGRIEWEPIVVDLQLLVTYTFNQLKSNAIKKQISLINEIPDKTYLRADTNMLSTVLRNLISNALKFSPVNTKIEVSSIDNEDDVQISIKDYGVGISAQNLERLFRIDESYTTLGTEKEKGTGLGLLLCKEFIEKHGGKITVKSKENEGSSFIFSIPKAKF